MKPLDFVRTPNGAIAIVTETNMTQGHHIACIDFIGTNLTQERNAWWYEEELQVIDSLPHLLARELAHPFGRGLEMADKFFKPALDGYSK